MFTAPELLSLEEIARTVWEIMVSRCGTQQTNVDVLLYCDRNINEGLCIHTRLYTIGQKLRTRNKCPANSLINLKFFAAVDSLLKKIFFLIDF